jgi:hypothetical protein
MAGEWEQYLADETLASEPFALDKNEPRYPSDWAQIDPLAQRLRSVSLRADVDFDNWVGWTYVAWRRLARIHRYQARLERTLLEIGRDRTSQHEGRIGRIANIAVGSLEVWRNWPLWPGFTRPVPELCVLLYADVPVPLLVDQVEYKAASERAGFQGTDGGFVLQRQFPVLVVPKLTFSWLRSVSNTPVASSGAAAGGRMTLQSGMQAAGQSAAGIMARGTVAMFAERPGHTGPSLVGARHVFGSTGSAILDNDLNTIARVVADDPILDVSIADLMAPWTIDYRLPSLNMIPGAPIMPTVQMPVQMFGSNSSHQTGFVMSPNFTAPSQPGSSIANNIMTNISAQFGDSGALLCSGYYTQPAIPTPYLAAMPQSHRDIYTCAALGVLQGRANQGVGPGAVAPTVFTQVLDVAAAFGIDLLTR